MRRVLCDSRFARWSSSLWTDSAVYRSLWMSCKRAKIDTVTHDSNAEPFGGRTGGAAGLRTPNSATV
jgi:hypothetical protein